MACVTWHETHTIHAHLQHTHTEGGLLHRPGARLDACKGSNGMVHTYKLAGRQEHLHPRTLTRGDESLACTCSLNLE